jgi:hypothetical protein
MKKITVVEVRKRDNFIRVVKTTDTQTIRKIKF